MSIDVRMMNSRMVLVLDFSGMVAFWLAVCLLARNIVNTVKLIYHNMVFRINAGVYYVTRTIPNNCKHATICCHEVTVTRINQIKDKIITGFQSKLEKIRILLINILLPDYLENVKKIQFAVNRLESMQDLIMNNESMSFDRDKTIINSIDAIHAKLEQIESRLNSFPDDYSPKNGRRRRINDKIDDSGISAKEFQKILNDIIKPAIAKSPSIPILEGISLTSDGNNLTIRGTNLEIDCQYILPYTGEKFQTVVNWKELYNAVKSLTGNLSFQFTTNKLEISDNNKKISLDTMSTEEFPPIPNTKDVHIESIIKDAGSFICKLATALPYTDKEEEYARSIFNVFLDDKNIAATDTYQLIIIPHHEGISAKLLIRPETIKILQKLKTQVSQDNMKILIYDEYIQFMTDNVNILQKRVDKRFPDYANVLPTYYNLELEIDSKELLSKLPPFKNMEGVIVEFNNNDEVALITDMGTTTMKPHIAYKNEYYPTKILIKHEYIEKILKTLGEGKISIGLTTDLGPITTSKSDIVILTMPMKEK